MMMPLVPPVTDALAEVAVAGDTGLSTRKAMMHPVALEGQLMFPPVTGLPVTLTNIRSILVFVLLNSVIDEQPTLAVVSVGPRKGVPVTLLVMGIPQSALTVPLVLQTYKLPEAPEVL